MKTQRCNGEEQQQLNPSPPPKKRIIKEHHSYMQRHVIIAYVKQLYIYYYLLLPLTKEMEYSKMCYASLYKKQRGDFRNISLSWLCSSCLPPTFQTQLENPHLCSFLLFEAEDSFGLPSGLVK